jgi:hypothetical protein
MDGWRDVLDGWTDGWTDGQKKMDGWTEKMDGWTEKWTDGRMHWTDMGPSIRPCGGAETTTHMGRADGFCEYSVRDRQTMLRHSREKHGGGLVGTTVFENTLVQYLFRSVSHVYFEVDPALTLTAGDNMNLDVRRYLRGAFLIGQEDNTVTKQDADRDRPPLLRITMWDTFQEEIRKDPAQRHAAHLLKAKHEVGEGDGIFVALDTAVKTYHAATRVLVNGCSNSFTIRKVLLNGPNFSPDQ